jgi:hypothetical protein
MQAVHVHVHAELLFTDRRALPSGQLFFCWQGLCCVQQRK